MYRKSDPLDQEKVNNKAMINKTAKMCAKMGSRIQSKINFKT